MHQWLQTLTRLQYLLSVGLWPPLVLWSEKMDSLTLTGVKQFFGKYCVKVNMHLNEGKKRFHGIGAKAKSYLPV